MHRTNDAVPETMVSRQPWNRKAVIVTVTLKTDDVTVRAKVRVAMVMVHFRVRARMVGFSGSSGPSQSTRFLALVSQNDGGQPLPKIRVNGPRFGRIP